MRLASWNVNSLKVRLGHVQRWLGSNPVEVLALQETKVRDEQFPAEAIGDAGYHVAFAGQSGYNGVALLSRIPPSAVVTELPGGEDPQRRLMAVSIGELRVVNVYVPNGREVGCEKYQYKLDWLARLRAFLAEEARRHKYLAVMGDFNIAPDDRDVHDPVLWRDRIHCSVPEREALAGIAALGLADSFRLQAQPAGVFSWWDYRLNSFRRNLGLRIDLIFLSPALATDCRASYVDIGPRGWERPSDHAPVVADIEQV